MSSAVSVTAPLPNPPSGWAELARRSNNSGRNKSSSLLYKVVSDASSEPTSYTFDFNPDIAQDRARVVIFRVSGVDTNNPFDAATQSEIGDNWISGVHDNPSITTVTDNAVVVAFIGLGVEADGQSFNPPAGMTEFYDFNSTFWVHMSAARVQQETAGSSGAKQFTSNGGVGGGEYVLFTIALRPNSAEASPPVSQNSNAVCDTADITDPDTGWDDGNGWDVTALSDGYQTVFDFQNSEDNTCATVTVTKSETTGTTIESRGYNTCDASNPRRVERGLRATY